MSMKMILLGAATLGALGHTLEAQQGRGEAPRGTSGQRAPAIQIFTTGASARAIIGVQTSGGSERDTLGLLISAITPGGPAEQAGLVEGNRLQEINGVSLRLGSADAGEPDMAGILQRRLERELSKVEPGQEVRLRVWADGRTREVRVTTAERQAATSVSAGAHGGVRIMRNPQQDERPVIGVSLGGGSSVRDTLGVLVIGVESEGPAERAGIYEGARIAEINGVSLRVSAADRGDPQIAAAMANRLRRELAKASVGDRVQLGIWSDGRYRVVTVQPVRAADLYTGRQSTIYFGDRLAPAAPMPPMAPMLPGGSRIRLDLDETAQQRIEDAMRRAREAMERLPVRVEGVWRSEV